MINDILRDLIDTGDVAVFIDNVLVGMEDEEKHDKIVEKVLKRMEKSNLYISQKNVFGKSKRLTFLDW